MRVTILLVSLVVAGCSGEVSVVADDTGADAESNVVDGGFAEDGEIGLDTGMPMPPVDSGVDAGTDAGEVVVMDAGRDSGRHDSGHDAGPVVVDSGSDAGSDAGPPPPPPSPVVAVASGGQHTCGLRADGRVSCWGSPGAALGYGSSANRYDPQDVVGLSDATAIAAGNGHTCATRSGGRVSCWGSNTFGQVGTGSASTFQIVPSDVAGVTDAVQVALGAEHSCVLNDDGPVDMGQCWGRNQNDQLGNLAAGSYEAEPFWVDGFLDGIEMKAHGDRTCVRRPDLSIWCWGRGSSFAMEPLTGGGLAVGQNHVCTIVLGPPRPRPWCVGSNTYGQLQTSVTTWPADTVQVAAGDHHTCARLSDGSVWCWGRNQLGQLGRGSTVPMDGAASQVLVAGSPIVDVVHISAGANHTCAVLSGGSVMCWGDNGGGQLGSAAGSMSTVPVDVAGL